jgi:serine/threonine protein kinase
LQPSSGSDWAATVMGTVIGTPAYMSPEQAAGRLDLLGPASDIYSLGATLYALLTGKAPFDESDKGELLHRVQHGAWLPPRQVKANTPAALDAICRKAMALKPEDRYPTSLALAADVEDWLADEPVTAYREPWSARIGRWLWQHKPVVASMVAVLVITVVALAVGLFLLNQEKTNRDNLTREMIRLVSDLQKAEAESDTIRREKERIPQIQELETALQGTFVLAAPNMIGH